MAKRHSTNSKRRTRRRYAAFIREFQQNGIRLLLENPENVHELLQLLGLEFADWIDYGKVKLLKNTFIKRDYRRVESDLVLLAPLRAPGQKETRKTVLIYVLIEHQSEPDELMPLRVIDYQVQVFNFQVRDWAKKHASLKNIRLQPVLPIVLYTGRRTWDSVGHVADLLELKDLFAERTVDLQPLYLNLGELPAEHLESAGGYLGWVLRLLQQRHSRRDEFERLLQRTIQHLEQMPARDRLRWLDFLSYVHAMIYHERTAEELDRLTEIIESSVATDEHRQEVAKMFVSAFQEAEKRGREQGKLIASRETLLRLLRRRFGDLPASARKAIQGTKDLATLEEWLDQVLTCESLEDFPFGK